VAATNGLPSHPLLTLSCIQFYLSTTYLYWRIYRIFYNIPTCACNFFPFPSIYYNIHDAPCISPRAQDKELPSHGFLTGHRSVTAAAATTTVDSSQSTTFFSPSFAAANVIIIIIITILLIIVIFVVVVNSRCHIILLTETRRVIIYESVATARENAFVCRWMLSQLLIAGSIGEVHRITVVRELVFR